MSPGVTRDGKESATCFLMTNVWHYVFVCCVSLRTRLQSDDLAFSLTFIDERP